MTSSSEKQEHNNSQKRQVEEVTIKKKNLKLVNVKEVKEDPKLFDSFALPMALNHGQEGVRKL